MPSMVSKIELNLQKKIISHTHVQLLAEYLLLIVLLTSELLYLQGNMTSRKHNGKCA